MVFRRRRRGEADPAAPDSSLGEYPTDDGLAETGDLPDEDEADELGQFGEEPDEDEEFDEYDADEEYDDESEEAAEAEAEEDAGSPEPATAAPRSEREDLGDPATWTRLRDTAESGPAHARSAGPWDSTDSFPEGERVDLGSLLVPVGENSDVQIGFSEETGITVAVVSGDSALQLQAFAAPRSSGLWAEVQPEIADEVAKAGGTSQEQEGSFGPELLAWITPPTDGGPAIPPQPLRFLGVDGPRWFLRGLITGPAALDPQLAGPLEDVFADVVVVRGDHAEPPRKPLEIQLPEAAREVLESQMAEEQPPGMPNPFERGPEITETR